MSEKRIKVPETNLEERIKRRSQENIGKQAKEKKEEGNENKINMLRFIAVSEPNGLSTSELEEKLGLHRDTIHSIGKDLQNKGIVTKKGKFGMYHTTKRVYGDPGLAAFLFGNESVRKVMEDMYAPIQCKFCKYEDILKGTSIEEKLLFMFAMRMAALVTYVMINATRPLPNKKRLVNVKTNGKEEKVDLLPRDKRLQTQLWVKNAIDPIQMLWEFVKMPPVRKGLALYTRKQFLDHKINPNLPKSIRKKILSEQSFANPDQKLWSPYELKKRDFKVLRIAFENIWPDMYKMLEKIRKSLPAEVESGYQTFYGSSKLVSNSNQ